ncbi:hypothetical protein ACFH04_41830 [Streptomyces noboritoensis]|uniref:Uncharacterized protein n=1 Tax=Streptomyces noboritoensis TaxID=67337 RepID=A0ABV6TCU5_9ACTN
MPRSGQVGSEPISKENDMPETAPAAKGPAPVRLTTGTPEGALTPESAVKPLILRAGGGEPSSS